MKGLSPLIGLALTIAISTFAVVLTTALILPIMNRMRDSNLISEALENLELINYAIREVASESEGSRRTITFSVTDGEYIFDKDKELVYFEFIPKSDLILDGIIGNVYLEKSPIFLDYFNNYQDNSNASPTWKIINGSCKVGYGMYYCDKGAAYTEIENITQDFAIYGEIIDKNGKGEIFPLIVPPENLILFLTFDEGFGNETYDYSLNYNNGTLLDANATNADGDTPPQWVDGKFGKALSFDGVDDYVKVPDTIEVEPSITVLAWAKSATSTYNTWGWIASSRVANGFIIHPSKDTKNYAGYILNSTGTYFQIGTYTFDDITVWHQYGIMYDADTKKAYLIVDGQIVVTKDLDITRTADTIPLDIGRDYYMDRYGNGIIDEVRIYNRALSEEEIKALYELGLRKLESSGKTDLIDQKDKIYLVISNPFGKSYFDNIKLKTIEKKMKLVVPFEDIDLMNDLRIGSGSVKIVIENKGLNEASNRPFIDVSR